MKVKLFVPEGARKSVKIQQHLKKLPNQGEFVEVVKLSENHPSVSSNILDDSLEVLDGSFSKIKPIGSIRTGPMHTSTPKHTPEYSESKPFQPKYEDISTPEPSDSDHENDVTFNFQTDVLLENETTDLFLREARQFIEKSNEVFQQKTVKRSELYRKREKYQRKVNRVQEAISRLDTIINITARFSAVTEELDKPVLK